MKLYEKSIIQVSILLAVCGFLIWHAVSWQLSGMYREMCCWLESDKAHIVVLYNTGFIAALALDLGLLLDKISVFFCKNNLRDKNRPGESKNI